MVVATGLIPFPGETKAAFEARTGLAASAVRVPIAGPPPLSQLGPTPMTIAGGTTQPATPGGGNLAALIPAGVAALVPAGVLAALGTAYGVSQAIGVQYPWETGPGEGFISPLTRDIKQDESGRWVTQETRPDLWGLGAAPSTAVATTGQRVVAAGPAVVKRWTANGWPFAMTSDGKIHTINKAGVMKSWRPYRSVVLGKTIKASMAKRAVRKLQGIVQLGKDIEKLGGTRVVYRKK